MRTRSGTDNAREILTIISWSCSEATDSIISLFGLIISLIFSPCPRFSGGFRGFRRFRRVFDGNNAAASSYKLYGTET